MMDNTDGQDQRKLWQESVRDLNKHCFSAVHSAFENAAAVDFNNLAPEAQPIAELEFASLQLHCYARERAFDAIAAASFDVGGTSPANVLEQLRSCDPIAFLIGKELKSALSNQLQTTNNVNTVLEELVELEERQEKLNAEVFDLSARKAEQEERNRAVRKSFASLRSSLAVREQARKRKILQLEAQISSLHSEIVHKSGELIKKKDYSLELEAERGRRAATINEQNGARLSLLQREHLRKTDVELRAVKKQLDFMARSVTKQLAGRYCRAIQDKRREVEALHSELAQADEEKRRSQWLLDARQRLAVRVELELKQQQQRNNCKMAKEVDELVRARQTLQNLWQEHPDLLKMSPHVSKSNNVDQPNRLKAYATALQGFIDSKVLPLADLPNDKLEDVFRESIEQISAVL